MPKIPLELKIAQDRARELGLPVADLTGRTISPEALVEVSEEAATFYQFVPIEKRNNEVEIGMINPDDLRSQEAIRFIAQRRNFIPRISLITPTDFKDVLKQYRNLKEEVETALGELEKELAKREVAEEGGEKEKKTGTIFERVMAEAPITKIVAVILRHAQEGRASDIHIEPTENNLKVRFRVDGVLYAGLILPKSIQSAVVSRIKILASLKIDETRIPQDGRFHSVIDNKKIDFRVSTFPTFFGEKAVMRLLDPTSGILTFEQLGLQGHSRRLVEEAVERPFGMILLTGPTGSGKTTTQYAILQVLNEEAVNIVSLEDPVEYFVEGVSQSQIRPEIGYTFASGLRSILRQDPDIIMVGEIRDQETAEMAIHASLTGHVVLSTLHTNSAVGAVPRLIDMGIQPFLISAATNVLIAQRLVRKLCRECAEKVEASEEIRKIILKEWEMIPDFEKERLNMNKDKVIIYKGKGCKHGNNEGYKGRIGIFETIPLTPDLQELILSKPSENQIEEVMVKKELINMRQDGILKVLRGETTLEEVLKATNI